MPEAEPAGEKLIEKTSLMVTGCEDELNTLTRQNMYTVVGPLSKQTTFSIRFYGMSLG
jgi:hypothetical protein